MLCAVYINNTPKRQKYNFVTPSEKLKCSLFDGDNFSTWVLFLNIKAFNHISWVLSQQLELAQARDIEHIASRDKGHMVVQGSGCYVM